MMLRESRKNISEPTIDFLEATPNGMLRFAQKQLKSWTCLPTMRVQQRRRVAR